MKNVITYLVLVLLVPSFLYAETSVSNVKVRYKKNGVIQTVTKLPGTSTTIYPDYNSNVDVTVTRTSNSGASGEYFLVDYNNGASLLIDSPEMSHTFYDCVGPLDAQIWTGVNSNEGRVEILVYWSTPPLPDLAVSNLRVNHTVNSNGLVFHVGESVDIDCGVYNFGTQSAPSSKLGYYIKSSSGNTSGSPAIVQSVSTLAGGSNYFKQCIYTFTNTDVGTRYIVVNGDDYETITEASETNNARSFGPFQVLPAPSISLTPSSFVFETTEVGSCSDESTFVLTNTSTQNVSGNISLRNSTDFNILEGGGQYNLSPGEALNILIQFCPLSEGAKSTVIQVSMDGYSTTVVQSSIAGTAVPEPEIISGTSDPFFLNTKSVMQDGIYLQIVETNSTNTISGVGYAYQYLITLPFQEECIIKDTAYFPVSQVKTAFLTLSAMPNDLKTKKDFMGNILFFNQNKKIVGHIGFDYIYEYESMHTRHALIFFHNDSEVCLNGSGYPYFPYSINNPNNIWKNGEHYRYDYYQDGEYPVSMLIPPHVNADLQTHEGYRFPTTYDKIPVLFVHGLNGKFKYPEDARVQYTSTRGDQVSYWGDVERKLNEKVINGNFKFHGWQLYYPNNDDIYHCGLVLKNAINYLHNKYTVPINIVGHSMGGLVTMDFLTRPGNYDQQRIGKVLLSMSPLHGSLKATAASANALGSFMKIIAFFFPKSVENYDGKAPCYRDLTVSSELLYQLHNDETRNWDPNLINSSYCIIGLTEKNYGMSWVYEEAKYHNDAAVTFSSGSLLDKGVGMIGIYGNHDAGRYSLLNDETLLSDIIESWIDDNTTSHNTFNSFCSNRGSIELVIDGQKNVLKSEQGSTINTLKSNIHDDVDFQKGMVSMTSTTLSSPFYKLFYNPSSNLYLLKADNHVTYSGFLNHALFLNSSITETHTNYLSLDNDEWVKDDLGFVFPGSLDCVPVQLVDPDEIPMYLGTLCRKNMEHQFVNYEETASRDLLADQNSPTKELIMNGVEKQSEIFVDNQTSSSTFIFYSKQAYSDSSYYSFKIKDPLNNIIDSTSNNIIYSNDNLTSVKRITINNPIPGKWIITPYNASPENNYITKGEFISEIRLTKNDSLKLYHNEEINISCLLDIPNFNLLINDSLTGYVNIHDGNGNSEILPLPDRTLTGDGMILSGLYMPDSAGVYFITFIIEGIYDGYCFERALYNDFEVISSVASLSIPDQELNIVQNFSDVKLPQYFNCNDCDVDSVLYEIGLEENGNFLEEYFHYKYTPVSNTIIIAVDQDSLFFNAEFWVNCYISDSIIAKDTFNVSFIPTGMPSGLYAYNIKEDSASLCWQPALFETEWQLAYGLEGFNILSADTLITVNTIPDYTLSGLLPSTSYDFYVRMITDSDTGYWAGPCTFTTLTTVETRNILKDNDHSVLIYPNPTSGDFTARFIMPSEGQLELSLYDLTGRLIQSNHSYRYMAGEFEIYWKNKNNLQPGIYILQSIAKPINNSGRFINDEFKIIVK